MSRRFAYAGGGAAAVVVIGLTVLLSSSATATGSKAGSPRLPASAAAVSARRQLIDILGVLRRSQTKADLDPRLIKLIGGFNRGRMTGFRGPPDLPLVRLATVASWGDKVFLVPFKPPTRESIATLPARLRPFAARRRGYPDTLGLFDSAGGACCSRAAGIEAGGDWASSGPSPNTLILVVPDGVAKVTVLLSPGPASKASHPVTAIVHNNVAAFLSPYAVENLGTGKMIWRAADGHVIKRSGGGP